MSVINMRGNTYKVKLNHVRGSLKCFFNQVVRDSLSQGYSLSGAKWNLEKDTSLENIPCAI